MTYKAYLVETVTGQVGRQLSIVGTPSWSDAINGDGVPSVTVLRSDLENLETKRYQAWYGSILLTYSNHQGEEVPAACGPINNFSDIKPESVKIECVGIRALLAKRYALRNLPPGKLDTLKFEGMSLGTIAKRVVEVCQDFPGGELPIRYATPSEYPSPGHQRTYESWNIPNLNVDDVLTKLSEVIGGPQVQFIPHFRDSSRQFIDWHMYTGTEHQPYISQFHVPDIDLTSEDNGVSEYSVTSKGSALVNRVYGTGAGDGAGTVVTYAENLSTVRQGYPFLASTISDSEIDKPKIGRLKDAAANEVEASQKPIDQLSITIERDHKRNPFGMIVAGCEIMVTVPDLMVIKKGTYPMRVIAISGGGANLQLELQEVSLA